MKLGSFVSVTALALALSNAAMAQPAAPAANKDDKPAGILPNNQSGTGIGGLSTEAKVAGVAAAVGLVALAGGGGGGGSMPGFLPHPGGTATTGTTGTTGTR